MITRDDIIRGFKCGKVKLIVDPNMDSGTVCQIGQGDISNWFYFGGLTAEELGPEEYSKKVPMDDIVDEIMTVLRDFSEEPDFQDEYHLYDIILNPHEHGGI